MRRATVVRFSGFFWLALILGCGDGSGPTSVSDAAPAHADPRPAAPETGERKAAPKGPSAVSPASAY